MPDINKKYVLLLLSMLLINGFIFSQDTLTKKQLHKQQSSFLIPGRPWTIEVPLWIPGFAGSFAYGDVTVEGEDGVDPQEPEEPPSGGIIGEIISRLFKSDWYLKFFFITKIGYEKNRLLIQLDGLTGTVGGGVKFTYNNASIVEAKFRSTNARLLAGYKFIETYSKNKKFRYELFGYLGIRGFFQNFYTNGGGDVIKVEFHPEWIEPIIGVQNQFTFKRWLIILQGDYGGTIFGNRYSFQFTSNIYYRTGRLVSLKTGWNHLYINSHGEFLDEPYKVKVMLSGPSMGLVFHF